MKKPFRTSAQLKQLIHIAKAQMHMDDAIYRKNLLAWTGKSSTTEMSTVQMERVLDGMRGLGFKPVAKAKQNRSKKPFENEELKKLGQIWTLMAAQGLVKNAGYVALEDWAVRQSAGLNNGVAIEKLEWMTDLTYQLIERLKRWHRRLMLEAIKRPDFKESYSDVLKMYELRTAQQEA